MRESLERVAGLVRKEFRQLFRDPRMVRLMVMSPMLQLVVFGYAVSTDVRHTRLFVVDGDRTAASRALVDAMTAGGWFRVVGRSDRPADAARALDHGRALVALQIPAGYARALRSPAGASVQVLVDGTNSNQATVALGYAEQIVRSHGLGTLAREIRPPVDLRERAWFNPSLASRNYNVPAVIGNIMVVMSLLLTSLSVVRERELGTLEQLMVSPLSAGELIAGKTIPFGLVAMGQMMMITAVALLWFRVPFLGFAPLLGLASLLFVMSMLGLGLLISTISGTQQEAFLTTFLIIMPIMLLSGFMFPVSSMPLVFQWLTLLNPLRHYLEIVRALFLKGSGLDALAPQYLALAVMGFGVLGGAATRFRKTVR